MKFTERYTIVSRRYVLFIVLFAILLIGGTLSAQSMGDYRTKNNGWYFENASIWQVFNGTSWVNTSQAPQSPFNGKITISSGVGLFTPFVLNGSIEITASLQLFDGADLTVNSGARIEMGSIWLEQGSKMVNNGVINATSNKSEFSVKGNTTFVNNGLISSNNSPAKMNLTVLTNGNFSTGAQGSFIGNGAFTANYGANMAIAHPLGLDGALAFTGSRSFNNINFIFNGEEEQITGTSMPNTVLGITFANTKNTILSTNLKLINTAKVEKNGVLSMGLNVFNKAWHGAGTFELEEGGTITTQHPEGINSNGTSGCIKVTTIILNSSGNLVYNGNTPQVTGNIVTYPVANTVNNLILDNPSGVTITAPVTVVGTMEVLESDVVYEEPPTGVDGYFSPAVNRIVIDKNGILMYGFEAKTIEFQNDGNYVNRKWMLKGNFTGAKRVNFKWSAADDGGFIWTPQNRPQVFIIGDSTPVPCSWDPDKPREVSVLLTTFEQTKGQVFYTIGKSDGEQTLPIILSSFNANALSSDLVSIQWTTQSETNTYGYYIYRAKSDRISQAIRLNTYTAATNTSQTQHYVFRDNELFDFGTYYYWLESVSFDGNSGFYGPVSVTLEQPDTGVTPIPTLPGIRNIAPNPMSNNAKISFAVPSKGATYLEVFNSKGQKIRTLVNDSKDSGSYSQYWDGKDEAGTSLAGGIYFIRLTQNGKTWQKKVTILK